MSMPHSWTYLFPVWMGGWTSNHEQQDTRALGFERVSSLSFFPVKYYIPLVNEESYGIDGPFSSLIYRRWWFSIGIASSRGRANHVASQNGEIIGNRGVILGYYLVVWNIFYFSRYWEFHHPNWLIFFRGVGLNQPPTSIWNKSPLLTTINH